MNKYVSFLQLIVVMSSCLIFGQSINQLNDNGLKQGVWKGYYKDSKNLRYEGQFDNGKEVGLFKFYDDTKPVKLKATREFDNQGGAYTIFYNGKHKVSEGMVRNKVYEGKWIYYHYNSPAIMTEENYADGKLHGTRKVFYESGKLAEEITYLEGLKHGAYKRYSENDVVFESSFYVRDKKHGPCIIKEADDKVIEEGVYKNGLRVGIWKHYVNGKLDKEVNHDVKKAAKPKSENPKKPKLKELKN